MSDRPSRRMRQMILLKIKIDRKLYDTPPVIAWTMYPRGMMNRWGDIGEVEVEYSPRGYRAVYGFTALGRVQCYMD